MVGKAVSLGSWKFCLLQAQAIVKTSGRLNKVALRYYMEGFDFADLRLDVAFRCGRWVSFL